MTSKTENVIVYIKFVHSKQICLTYPSITFFFISMNVPVTLIFGSKG